LECLHSLLFEVLGLGLAEILIELALLFSLSEFLSHLSFDFCRDEFVHLLFQLVLVGFEIAQCLILLFN